MTKKLEKPFWPDKQYYFITTSTFLHFPYFKNFEQKMMVLKKFKNVENKLNLKIEHYSIAINHFHYFTFLDTGLLYGKIKGLINGSLSYEYRKKYKTRYSEMWQSSKALIVRDEEMYWQIIGYIIGNLIKHKEVNTFNDLLDNPFSSFYKIVEKYGEEFARSLVYRVIDVNENAEGNIDVTGLKKINISDITHGLKP